ncbi:MULTISPECIES: hypothetical protein [Agrobacterium]|jgi:hypothetical protein|uniref:Uncharacterized protein n=1 Tax=Agrobacterium tumefaciens TaxID=358 RepID=A0AAP5DCA2_AGRTU|nr:MULTISPECIES: hypothetical protein [Agrobacterium tumefaciens complex]MBB4405714.1 hypothetical protein [Agrobacterium radiobacter]MBB4450878.1 hypothetical protein [Agrobacterium radiobacter]MBP2570166.1 hypothetical protein [Agrobacterium tumefaciens]MDP9787334.1 hypothetical protein [Agrobacterium tumefaciens]MDP9854137.1 hypothetical protein [Agrobacterium tumefaciens]
MKTKALAILFSAGLLGAQPAHADEREFLSSLKGTWAGKGTVITRIGTPPINVNCTLNSNAGASSLNMSGTCRGLLVVRRAIAADLSAKGGRYSGAYTGPSGRPSALSGTRRGNAINLTVRWNRDINGDRVAAMTIEKVGANGLRLRTTDKDGRTGKTVVTSDIRLVR